MNEQLELYAQQHSSFGHPLLDELLRTADVRLLQPRMVCGPTQAGLLSMLIHLVGARRVLELGAYSGYSTIAMALALKAYGGEVDSIEHDGEMIHFLTPFVERSGCADRIHIHHGEALEIMPRLLAQYDYDLVYMDANKRQYPDYYRMLCGHLHPGAILIADNTLWDGKVTTTPIHRDLQLDGIQQFNQLVSADPAVEQLLLPLRDGLTIIRFPPSGNGGISREQEDLPKG